MSSEGKTAQMVQRMTALHNEEQVFKVLREKQAKMSIAEIASEVHITERTVRRCIKDLVAKDMVRAFGRVTNGVQYGLADKSMYESPDSFGDEELKVISYAGGFITVQEFIEMMVAPDQNPLASKEMVPIVRTPIANGIRRAMAGVVLSSANAGQDSYLDKTRGQLQGIEDELRFLLRIVQEFNQSMVWFDHYRDKVGYQARIMQRNNPELFQLAIDFIRSE